jgi:hypothetical protein
MLMRRRMMMISCLVLVPDMDERESKRKDHVVAAR